MTEAQMRSMMQTAVRLTLNELTDEEVLAQRLAVLLNSDPRPCYGYDKAKSLYTEADGTKMHAETREAFLAVSAARLGL